MTQNTESTNTHASEGLPDEAAPRAIVGIGASAGGLQALEQFFTHMPPDTGMAFVLVTHMDPEHKGMLPELIQRATEMPVIWAEDGMAVRPNSVYVKPANADLAILHGSLTLLEPVATRTSRTPIDLFFRHLADDQDGKAVGIVLSGMGHDGTLGIRAIKERMGTVLVQEPHSAQYGSMPENAIATGLADYAAPVEELPDLLIKFVHSADTIAGRPGVSTKTMEDSLKKVFVIIRSRTGQDFSMYKRSTIQRRIERRMGLHQLTRIEDYVRYLRENPTEIEIIAKELLIGVTRFFRDPEAWEAFREKAIRSIAESAPEGGVIRVWVPGCSTGEEAYSIAMVLHECLETLNRHGEVKYQIFATDLDQEAIEIARRGRYIAAIAADVSPKRLERFFDNEGDHYRIRQEIRENVIFARQNLIADPPFTHLDILSCRNLLIYLAPELQKKLIPLFHYTLKPGGTLFLGTAETIGSYGELFRTVDSRWKIYRRRETSAPVIDRIDIPVSFAPHSVGGTGIREQRHPASIEELAPRILINRFVPPSVIVNENGDIAYFHGKTGKYLEPSSGKANLNIYAMAREGLSYPLVASLRSAKREKRESVIEHVSVKTNGSTQQIRLTVAPIERSPGAEDLFMIAFEDIEETETPQAAEETGERQDDARYRELERGAHLCQIAAPEHGRRDAGLAGGAEDDERGAAEHQRRTAEHQRGADHLKRGTAVAQRGAPHGEHRTPGQDRRALQHHRRYAEPSPELRACHALPGQKPPGAPVHRARQRDHQPAVDRPRQAGRRSGHQHTGRDVRRGCQEGTRDTQLRGEAGANHGREVVPDAHPPLPDIE